MRFLKLSLILFCLNAHASGGGGGEGGEGAASAGAGGPMPKDQKEFTEKSSKLNSLINRIAESEKKFNELVHHKNQAKTTAEKQTIIHEMNELTKQRNKDVDTYNQLKSELALRYPNQGERLNRSYQTQTKRTVEELEGVAGLDELLTRTKKAVEKKYAPFMGEDEKREVKKKGPHQAEADEPKRLRLEK